MALFLLCQIISYVVNSVSLLKLQNQTSSQILKTRDLNFITETSKFVHFAEIFQRCCLHF